ncbi:MAG: hypothetical protein HZB13_05970 [Acidobacteria bacterium]|nr:hypothetical protein [Acidobacteriota bacterium]
MVAPAEVGGAGFVEAAGVEQDPLDAMCGRLPVEAGEALESELRAGQLYSVCDFALALPPGRYCSI